MADEPNVETGGLELVEVVSKVIGFGTDVTTGAELDNGVVLTLERDVGVGATTEADLGVVVALETGFTGAAVFWKQVQPLDSLETGTPARLRGTGSLGVLRNFGQKMAASLEKRSNARRVLSSKQVKRRCTWCKAAPDTPDVMTLSVRRMEGKVKKCIVLASLNE